ncbi:MAG: T9SS type A sorting domain-containing protein [Bacteroidia bacterium]|nr:T9SS type A sorting domain-containing protein [Bacteroidia bacterium]
MIFVYMFDCNGVYMGQSFGYSPFLNQFVVTFNYCNTIPPTSTVICVTVNNLPGAGTTVPVIVYSAPGTVGDTLLFTGTGTQTLCDTFQLATGTNSFIVSMIDCNGNNVSTVATANPMFPTTNVTLDYCQVLTPVTVCGTVSGTNGMSVPVIMVDSLSGNLFTIMTDTSGNFCDSLLLPSPFGLLLAYIIDCNGVAVYQTAPYSPTGPNYNFSFNYCNTIPTSVVVCVTVDNLPGVNTTVPVIVNANGGGTGSDTLLFMANGSLTICDTIQTTSTGVVLITMTDCNGNTVTQAIQYNPMLPVVNVTLDYCPTTPPCYAFWTSTYDSLMNTFYITVDSVTLAQAQTFFWDFGDSTFSTLPNPTHQFAANGLYNVCLTINATGGSVGCTYCHTIGITPNGSVITRTAGFNVVVLPQNTTSIDDDIESLNYSIYPNPVSNMLNVEVADAAKDVHLTVYTTTGIVVQEELFENSSKIRISTSAYKSGLYILKLNSDSGTEFIKFVKQ